MVRRMMRAAGGAPAYAEPDSDTGDESQSEHHSTPPEALTSDDNDSTYGTKQHKKKTKKVTKSPATKSSPKKNPRKKISPAKTPASQRQYRYPSDDSVEEDSEDEMPRKRGLNSAKRSLTFDDSDEELPKRKKATSKKSRSPSRSANKKPMYRDDPESEESDEYETKPLSPKKTPKRSGGRSPSKKTKYRDESATDEEVSAPKRKQNVSPSKRTSGRSPTKKGFYRDDSEEEEDDSEDSDPPPSKKISLTKRGRGRLPKASPRKQPTYSSDESLEDSDASEAAYKPKKQSYLKAKKTQKRPSPKKTPQFPKTSEMVIDSIKALKENPRKGSTLGTIKETILLNWPVDMNVYDKRIKKYILNAVETGEIIRVKGTGFRGRFTVPGMKMRRKKSKPSLGKKYDEDEEEYKPAKTKREEEKERNLEELERQRHERKIMEEQKLAEKANRPAKPRAPRPANKEYEVECIKGIKVAKDGSKKYLVKFAGWPKPQWESEENVAGCQSLIDAYMIIKEKKDREAQDTRKMAEEEGSYEVGKIVSMKEKKNGRREFLVRWKGFGPEDDTWEPEEHLNCDDLIAKFETEWETLKNSGGKNLREAPKQVQRLEFTSSRRDYNNRGGFRVSYVGMDD